MSKQSTGQSTSARERILQVASDLFYRQGYRATGINEVIQKSGVAKATFYNHFPSKDELGKAYLSNLVGYELAEFDATMIKEKQAEKRFLLPLQWIRQWLRETEFRGCAFLHTVAEFPDPKNPLRRYGKQFYDTARERVQNLVEELIASDTKKYGHLNTDAVTKSYMVILAGTIALAQIYHDEWPVDDALSTVQKLIAK